MKKLIKNINSINFFGLAIKPILLLLLGSFLIRINLANFGTLTLDQNTFIAWGRNVAEVGFSRFYDGWSDYLPGYIYVLWFLAKIEPFLAINPVVFYKLPAIFGDLAVGYLIYKVLVKKGERLALISSSLFLVNPAVLSNSTFWGQVDILTSLSTLIALSFINIWPVSAVSLALGMAVKPQALMVTPVLFCLMLAQKWPVRKIFFYAFTVFVVWILLFVPFNNTNNFLVFILERVNTTLGQYPYTSVNAFNLWGLFGFWKDDSSGIISPKNIGTLILISFGIFSLVKRKLVAEKPYHFLALFLFANFLFFTRMHERHLLPTLAPMVIAMSANNLILIPYIGVSLIYIANMAYAYHWITNDFSELIPPLLVKGLIISNIFLFFLLLKETLMPSSSTFMNKLISFFTSFREGTIKIKDNLTKDNEKTILIFILVFALVTRLIRLDFPKEDYFDEIYHTFTARQMVYGDERPWHWNSAHPEGFAYEWTHPPVAKEIMALSMGVLGINSLAARLPGALAGVLIVYMTYLIAKKLFKSRDIALISAALIALDGLILTMSRIGTADVFFVAFALVSFYLFLKNNYFFSALFLGISLATKWSTLWLIPVFFLAFILTKAKLRPSLLWFLVLPLLVYLASYLPMFAFGHNLETFWGMQKQMWWYHSGLVAEHPYTSPWWSWPIMGRPVYLYQNYQNGIVANIYALGNPFFFWFGLTAVLVSIFLIIKKRNASLTLLVLGYLALFAPWAASPRIMFLYHYLPSLPFMAIILGFVLKKFSKIFIPVLLIIIITFIYFYPHWTAIFVPENIDKSYYWFSSWR